MDAEEVVDEVIPFPFWDELGEEGDVQLEELREESSEEPALPTPLSWNLVLVVPLGMGIVVAPHGFFVESEPYIMKGISKSAVGAGCCLQDVQPPLCMAFCCGNTICCGC